MRKLTLCVAGLALATLCGSWAFAQDAEPGTMLGDQIDSLRKTIQAQADMLEEMKKQLADMEAKQKGPASAGGAEKVKISGDFRYRHEFIDDAGKSDSRTRHRIRARLGLDGKVNDQVTIKTRLASGADDPISTNQTLAGGFTSKGIYLDRAYFEWKPSTAPGMKVLGGKFGVPFYKAGGCQLIWDDDLNVEGLAISHSSTSERLTVFGSIGDFWAEERSSADDTMLFGAQVGFSYEGASTLTMGVGAYNYSNSKGFAPLYDSENSFGNSTDEDGNYMYDYNLVEGFAEYALDAGETPIALYGDYVKNNDPSTDNKGYLYGVKIGKKKAPGTWDFTAEYRRLERDAVLAAFCDSDFRGGGTDGKGWRYNVGYQLADAAEFGVTYFVNDKGIESGVDYKRLQVDFQFKY
jgi:hypothetical protein